MSDTPAPATPSPCGDVLFRRVGEDWLLFDPRTQDVHVLNLTAALVWAHCDGEHDEEDIRGAVTDIYPGVDAISEVRRALERFRELGLLEEG